MAGSCIAAAFVWAPNFREGLIAAGRIVTSLNEKSTIVDPEIPAFDNFVSVNPFHYNDVNSQMKPNLTSVFMY